VLRLRGCKGPVELLLVGIELEPSIGTEGNVEVEEYRGVQECANIPEKASKGVDLCLKCSPFRVLRWVV
jgi:hypothetical protein